MRIERDETAKAYFSVGTRKAEVLNSLIINTTAKVSCIAYFSDSQMPCKRHGIVPRGLPHRAAKRQCCTAVNIKRRLIHGVAETTIYGPKMSGLSYFAIQIQS